MSDKQDGSSATKSGTAFQRSGTGRHSEYETEQEAFWKNYERLRAERLAREAARSTDK
jgi:hypothetical protein